MFTNVGQTKPMLDYKKLKTRLFEISEDIRFNKRCLSLQLVPKYAQINIRNPSESAQKAKRMAERIWVTNELRRLHSLKSTINYKLYKVHLEFLNTTPRCTVEPILQRIHKLIWPKIRSKRRQLASKLRKLLDIKNANEETNDLQLRPSEHVFYKRLHNCTDIHLTDAEIETLNKGLKFNFPSFKGSSHRDDILSMESTIKMLPTQDMRSRARTIVSDGCKNMTNNNKSNADVQDTFRRDYINIKGIKEKLQKNNAIIIKADKGNTAVIINNDSHIHKVEEFIANNNISVLDRDPTLNFTKEANLAINSCNSLLKNDAAKRSLKQMNPRAPVLNGLPKIHKENIPIRPVVDYTTAPAYKLAKKLQRVIKAGVILKENFSIKNTYDFINKTKNVKVSSSHKMSSLDITNMYANIPVDDTISILERNLKTSKIYSAEVVDDILKLLKVVLKQNYFTFNGKYYLQTEGLAMGSPLSGLLADVFMNHFERKYIMSNPAYKNKILAYYRYVDDTFMLFDGTTRQIESMVSSLNKTHPNIKFTLEHEADNKISFLDAMIVKQNGNLAFKVYRKPTTTNSTIHSSSFHPLSQKRQHIIASSTELLLFH